MELPAFLSSPFFSTLLSTVIIILVGQLVIQAIMKAIDATLSRTHLEKAAHSLLKSIARVVLYFLLLSILASKWGVDLTSVIAIASVATLAVSLALQAALSNVVSGLILLSSHPFRAGDFVEISGQSGTVTEVGITYTKLQTPDSKVISIPNSGVTGAQIINYTQSGKRRVDLTVGISYDCDVDAVLDALKEVAQLPYTLSEEDVFAGVNNYGESSVSYVLRFWVKAEDYWDAYFAAQKRMLPVLGSHGISMSYPHLNVHIEK